MLEPPLVGVFVVGGDEDLADLADDECALARRAVLGPRVLDMRCITGGLAIDLAAAGREVTARDGYAGKKLPVLAAPVKLS